jgi:iron complex transport system substrate-binding protein
MDYTPDYNKPLRIICLTEESVETLFEIGAGEQIIGVSQFVKRPKEALDIPKVSMFTSSNLKKIIELKPDLVLGFSDIQKDIAKDLIEQGIDVWIANHRSIDDLLKYISTLSKLVDRKDQGNELIEKILRNIQKAQSFSQTLKTKPKVYFEEWDDPLISAISWVSEIIEICGGVNIFKSRASGNLAKERFVTHKEIIEQDPDIVLACHCGKKVKIDKIKSREGYDGLSFMKSGFIFELEPEIFLQPGPAAVLDGIDQIINIIEKWRDK